MAGVPQKVMGGRPSLRRLGHARADLGPGTAHRLDEAGAFVQGLGIVVQVRVGQPHAHVGIQRVQVGGQLAAVGQVEARLRPSSTMRAAWLIARPLASICRASIAPRARADAHPGSRRTTSRSACAASRSRWRSRARPAGTRWPANAWRAAWRRWLRTSKASCWLTCDEYRPTTVRLESRAEHPPNPACSGLQRVGLRPCSTARPGWSRRCSGR